jgi:hypothetical protein
VRLFLFAAALAVALAGRAGVATAQADVALVLAVDVSGSVSDERFLLQREGIAKALDSDAFAATLSSGAHGVIEIAVVEWAEEQAVIVPWTVLRNRRDLAALAERLRRAPRSWVHTRTDPSGGIAAAERLFAELPLPPERRVIDLSGDGVQNAGEITTTEARDKAIARAITINGLPITSGDDPHVDDWYRANVVGGPGHFMIVADGFEAFADAFRQKLTTEVAGATPPARTFASLP